MAWSGLAGADAKIGRFLVTQKDYDRLTDNYDGPISFDLWDDGISGDATVEENLNKSIDNC